MSTSSCPDVDTTRVGPVNTHSAPVLPKGRRLWVAQSTPQFITGIHLCTTLDQSPNINMVAEPLVAESKVAQLSGSTVPRSLRSVHRTRKEGDSVCLSFHQETWSTVNIPDPVTDRVMDSRAVLFLTYPLAVQTVLKTVEIPQELSLEKGVGMLSGVHHQMLEDPNVLEIARVHQVQLIDKVADVSA